MEKLKLQVLDVEQYRDDFPLWSIFYVQCNNECFPDDRWFDATSSILEMWANVLTAFVLGNTDFCTLDFMDGDYAIRFNRASGKVVEAIFEKRRHIVFECASINLPYFTRQILAAAEKLRNSFPEEKRSNSAERLFYEIDKLRTVLKQYSFDHNE